MIPALIFWLWKRYLSPRLNKRNLLKNAIRLKSAVLILFFSFSIASAYAQTSKFAIKRNGRLIGQLSFSYNTEGDDIFLRMNSKVNTRILFKIDVETQDFAHFKNGKLLASTVKRSVNGDEKEAKETRWINNSYQTLAGNKAGLIKQPISYNMMLLYTKEPLNISEVYSDNFQCFLPIIKKGEHQYRIKLPDGNYNDYLFENGICRQVIINHTMYTIKMERI